MKIDGYGICYANDDLQSHKTYEQLQTDAHEMMRKKQMCCKLLCNLSRAIKSELDLELQHPFIAVNGDDKLIYFK